MGGPITKATSAWAVGLMQIRVGNSSDNIATASAVLTAAHSLGALANTKFVSTVDFFKQESGFPLTEDGVIALRIAAALECGFKETTPYNMALTLGIDPTASVSAQAIEGIALNSTAGTVDSTKDITADDTGSVSDVWTVVFTGATAGSIFGKNTGHVHDFTDLTSAMAPDNDGHPYFTIPASFFTGTWAADDTYVFGTQAGGAATYASTHSGSLALGIMTAPSYLRVEGIYTFPNGTNTMTYILPRVQAVANMEVDHQEESEAVVPVRFEAKKADSSISGGNAVWDNMSLGQVIWA